MDDLSRDAVLARLTGLFRGLFDDDSIVLTWTTTARDIPQWDSLNQVRLILACETEFGIRLKARQINALSNVGDMIDHIIGATKGKR